MRQQQLVVVPCEAALSFKRIDLALDVLEDTLTISGTNSVTRHPMVAGEDAFGEIVTESR